jgi:hypothetical protein
VASFIKDPDAVLDYKWDWAYDGWLAEDETILTSTIIAETGVTVDDDTNDDTTATVWLSGGSVGETYTVTNRITTNQGRTDDRTMKIFIRQR